MNKKIDISNIILKTERILLRPFKMTDVEDFYEYAKVDGVGQMAGWSPHKNIEESKQILEMFINSKRQLAIEIAGKVVGSLGFEYYKEKNFPEYKNLLGTEIGYVLSKDYWGHGYMPEAVKAAINYLFAIEKVDFIMCGHFKANNQSKRVIEKCGFIESREIEYDTTYGKVGNNESHMYV